MRSKGFISFLMMIILLLSGCGVRPDQPLQPVYDTTPAAIGAHLAICGKELGIYGNEKQEYVKGSELAEALDGDLEIYEGVDEHQAVITAGITTYSFTTFEGKQTTSSIYYLKNCLYDGKDWFCPKDAIISYLELKAFEDEDLNVTYYGTYPDAQEIPAGVEVPVLMYHALSDNPWGIRSLFLSPSDMEEQLKYLTENGYTPIWFEDLKNVKHYEKPVILTFDDGYDDSYTELFPLLKKYKVKASVMMITGSIGDHHYLNEAQIKEMSESGLVSFQSHTVTHRHLNAATKAQLEKELVESKETLAKITGKVPFVLCYPNGRYSEEAIKMVGEHYEFGLLMTGETYVTGQDPLMIYRKYIERDTTIEEFIEMVGGTVEKE